MLHAAFFVGSRAFYRALREMPESELAKFRMTAVSYVNELYGEEAAKRQARVKARFINAAMMATLLGAIVSDGLENGQVVSGVGGQYNFVAQGFALEDARSIIIVRATRTAKGRTSSNIRWRYAHETIPRHLRDIVVTEYGIADLRGKTDRDVIAAMLAVADSRFQDELLREAKDAGKIEQSFVLPAAFRDNTPERIERALAGRAPRACWRRFRSRPISPRSSSGCCRRWRPSRRLPARRFGSPASWRGDWGAARPRPKSGIASPAWGSSDRRAWPSTSTPRYCAAHCGR